MQILERNEFKKIIYNLLDKSNVEIGHKRRIFLAVSWKKYNKKLSMHLSDYKDFGEIISKMKLANMYTTYRMIVTKDAYWD